MEEKQSSTFSDNMNVLFFFVIVADITPEFPVLYHLRMEQGKRGRGDTRCLPCGSMFSTLLCDLGHAT